MYSLIFRYKYYGKVVIKLYVVGKSDVTDKNIAIYNSSRYCVLCRECGNILAFNSTDVKHNRFIPHVECPCGKEVQLPRKYL